jgi:hypothetical protein
LQSGLGLWGVDYLRCKDESDILSNPVQKFVLMFLRILSGCTAGTRRWALLQNFGLEPVQVQWACHCARVWNTNILKDNLTGVTLRTDLELMLRGSEKCWTALFLTCMHYLGLIDDASSHSNFRRCAIEVITSWRFDEDSIRSGFESRYKTIFQHVGQDPRLAPRKGAALNKFIEWFHDPACMHHLKFSAPEFHVRTLMKFRLGCVPIRGNDHSIRIRQDRTCEICRSNYIEDEKHLIYECPCYDALRSHHEWSPLYEGATSDLKAFMNQKDQAKLSRYIVAILKHRRLLHEPRTTAAQPPPRLSRLQPRLPRLPRREPRQLRQQHGTIGGGRTDDEEDDFIRYGQIDMLSTSTSNSD